MLPVPKTPNLKLNTEEQHWFWALTFQKQIILLVVERVSKDSTSPEHESFTEFSTIQESIKPPENESEMEPEQPPLTPDMSPNIRPEAEPIEISMPCFSMSETKLSVMVDKIQDVIPELCINTTKIFLAQEGVSQNRDRKNFKQFKTKAWEGFQGR